MYILILVLGFLLACFCFYEAYNIQQKEGIVEENKIVFFILAIISILQLIPIIESLGLTKWYLVIAFLALIGVDVYLKLFFRGRKITIYVVSIESVLVELKQLFKDFSISYTEDSGLMAEEVIIRLDNNDAQIKIAKSGDEDIATINVFFKKMWRIPDGVEIEYRFIESLKKSVQIEFIGDHCLRTRYLELLFLEQLSRGQS